jgi:hypothetical protein
MATPATHYAAVASGPIPYFNGTTGQQTCVPLSAITFSNGGAIFSYATTDPIGIWLTYLVSAGVIAPGPLISPPSPGGTGATAAPAGGSGSTSATAAGSATSESGATASSSSATSGSGATGP